MEKPLWRVLLKTLCYPGLGRDEIRLAYVLKEDDLHKAAIILKEGLEKYLELKNK